MDQTFTRKHDILVAASKAQQLEIKSNLNWVESLLSAGFLDLLHHGEGRAIVRITQAGREHVNYVRYQNR